MKWKTWLVFPSAISVAALTGTFIAAALVQNATPIMYSETIKLSAERGRENLIEIFSDGLDLSQQQALIENNPAFKDFALFTNFYAQGVPTHGGRPSELGGFENFNAFRTLSKHPGKTLYEAIYEEGEMTEAMKFHFETLKPHFEHQYLINTYDLLAPRGSNLTSPEYARQALLDVEITTSSGTLEGLTDSWGVNESSQAWRAFPYFVKVATIDPSLTKGSHVLISDLTTHSPKATAQNGKFTVDASLAEVSAAVTNGLATVIKKLQDLQNNDAVAYDNSMIIVYGDHSEHTLELDDSATIPFLHAHSALLIKYPNTKQAKLKIVDNALVYGSQINGIIKNYFKNRPSAPLDYFTLPRFDLNRPLYINNSNSRFLAAKYDATSRGLIRDESRQDIEFNPSTVESDIAKIYMAVSAGSDE